MFIQRKQLYNNYLFYFILFYKRICQLPRPIKGRGFLFGGGDYDEETVTVGGAYYPSTGHHLVPVSKGDRIYFYFASNSDDYF